MNRVCEAQGIDYVDDTLDFNFPGIGLNLIIMAAEGFLFFGLTLLLEQEFFIHQITGLFKKREIEPVEISSKEVSTTITELRKPYISVFIYTCIFVYCLSWGCYLF